MNYSSSLSAANAVLLGFSGALCNSLCNSAGVRKIFRAGNLCAASSAAVEPGDLTPTPGGGGYRGAPRRGDQPKMHSLSHMVKIERR